MTSVPRFAEHGIDALCLAGPGGAIVDWLRDAGIEQVVLSPDFPGGWRPRRGLARVGLLPAYWCCRAAVAATVRRLVEEHGIDLIYAAMPFAWAASTPVARELGIPVVWRAGGPVWLGSRLGGSAVIGPWSWLHPPDLLIASSEMVRKSFRGLVPARLEAVLNGVDTVRFHPGAGSSRELRPRSADLVVGFAGRLVARKGIETLLEAAGRLADVAPGVRFLIAGAGKQARAYEALARRTGALRNTRFLGYRAEMADFYAACDVVALPSLSEGASMVVLEAMASGCVPLVSDVPSLQELVRHGQDGWIVPVADPGALVDAICRMNASPGATAALGKAARVRAREAFDASRTAARIAALLHEVARRGPVRPRRWRRPGARTRSPAPAGRR